MHGLNRIIIAASLVITQHSAAQSERPEATEGAYEAMILDYAREFEILDAPDGLNALIASFARTFEQYQGMRPLTAIEDALTRPLSLDAVEARVADRVLPLRTLAAEYAQEDFERIAALIEDVLDLETESELGDAPLYPIDQRQDLLDLVTHMSRNWRLNRDEHQNLIDAIRATHTTEGHDVRLALRGLLEHATSPMGRASPEDIQSILESDLPRADEQTIAQAVTGKILGAFWLDDQQEFLLIIGSEENNSYDMSRIAHVIDVGGDDTYRWPATTNLTSTYRGQSIIDLAGNDTYISEAPFAGPATAAFGWSLIDDRGGNDIYRTHHRLSIGAALMGVAVLIDRAGDEIYEATGPDAAYNIGVGYYGAGLVIDCTGSDVYRGEKLTQGIGGPRGLGAIIDLAGNDIYHANGPSNPSVYGTSAVYVGLAQGFGFGVRGFAAGGIGAIYDFVGNDQYIGGEFTQGGGYFFALGILRDLTGHDIYHGNRYSQAFAAHQAAGILIDDAGDDTYWSKTAAGQSGSWDQCVTMFIDKAGNDSYRCDGLGLGGASMQAIAIFIDLEGNDRYSSAGQNTLGQSGGDSYHYERDKVFSFSAFFDLGGGHDTYPPRGPNTRTNDSAISTGQRNEQNPADSTQYGIFVDQ